MIKSFKNKDTLELFKCNCSRKIPSNIADSALRKLWVLNAAQNIHELRHPPANHLERLKGDRKGQYSIRINLQWRICFYWVDENAYEVEIVDYH